MHQKSYRKLHEFFAELSFEIKKKKVHSIQIRKSYSESTVQNVGSTLATRSLVS